jgi:hypothetical protein
MLVKVFGYGLTAGALATSIAMFLLGDRFQQIEVAAYGGTRRPLWFWSLSLGVIGLYLAALNEFLRGRKTPAGWVLMVLVPLGWSIKAALVVFNPAGQRQVVSISGDAAWRRVAIARFPVAVLLGILTAYS